MDNLLNLLKGLGEIYQDIILNDTIVAKGVRQSQERWDIIKPHIKPHNVVLDVGSYTGYYSQKIAHKFPDSLVISVESDPIMCQIQKEIFKREGLYNIVVCNHRISVQEIIKWSNHVEIFDVILSLAVLHHFPESTIEKVFESFQKLSKIIINEVPLEDEQEACGQKVIPEVYKVLNKSEAKWLGCTKSHLGDRERHIGLYMGNKAHFNLDAFFGVSHPDRHKFEIKDGKINGKNIIAGVNAWSLLHFNPIWPEPYWWIQQAKSAYEGLTHDVYDVRPWNLLVTSTGLKAIDTTSTNTPQRTEEDIRKLISLFSAMKPLEWDKI